MSKNLYSLPKSLRSSEFNKTDLEFLRRQLNIADKRVLRDALEKGISEEEEAVLVEILIMKRLIIEARQYEKQEQNYYTVGVDSFPSKFSSPNESECNKNEIISHSEEPLDPVTLSIVKRILHHKFAKKNENQIDTPEGMEGYATDVRDTIISGNCNFEIVLKERFKVTVAKRETPENVTGCSNSEDNVLASSSGKITRTPNFTHHRSLNSDQICQDIHLGDKVDHTSHQKCIQFEVLDNRLSKNPRANNISETLSKNDITSNTHRDYAALVEECIQLGMPKKKELSEETVYANTFPDPGYLKYDSSTNHEISSITLSEPNENTSSKTFIINAEATDAQALVEECIKLGMTHKNETLITSTQAKNSVETFENHSSSELNEKPDYISLLEECIQLGMPKKKELFPETRSSSPKSSSFPTNFIGGHSGISTSPLVNRSEQNHINPAEDNAVTTLPFTKEDPQEAIYANISAIPGYTRLLPTYAVESKKIQEGPYSVHQDYSALIDECIKLGMPSKKKFEANSVHGKYNSNETSCNTTPNYEALIEECIQLGMPKKKEISEAIYANRVERYTSFNFSPSMDSGFSRFPPIRMIRSDSEPGPNKNPFVSFGNSRSGSAFLPNYSSMDRALEECIQLGWPKKKEIVTDRRTNDVTAVRDSSKIITVEKTKESESKNVDVASVARNTPEYLRTCFRTLDIATGAEDDTKLPGALRLTELPDVEEMQLTKQEKNGYKYLKFEYPSEWITESIKIDNENEDGSEMSFADLADVDAKLLDPKAMLEALDKYTAELICQAELRLTLQHSNL